MDIHVARQPIFTKSLSVYGYELLYRSSATSTAYDPSASGNAASSNVIINSFYGIGLEKLTGGRRAFVNFTEDLLLNESATLFPSDKLVVEVLEDVAPSELIIKKCKGLKRQGYRIALDDFVFAPKFLPLMQIADIIKVDFMLSSRTEIANLVHRHNRANLYFLAEKIETREDYELAVKMGFSLFQGYFFSKPVTISDTDIRPIPVNYMHLMQEVNNRGDDINFSRIARIIMQDVSLSYKLLRLVNSVAFGFRRRIRTVIHALVALGTEEVRKWVTLLSMMGVNKDQPEELLQLSTLRAKFCEYLAKDFGLEKESSQLFMMGLFSLMDAITGHPIGDVLKDVVVPDELRDALVKGEGPYMPVYSLVKAYEKGDWDTVAVIGAEYGIGEKEMTDAYMNALQWCNIIFE